jgi:hypothetical protein
VVLGSACLRSDLPNGNLWEFNRTPPMGVPPLRLPTGPELRTAQRLNASIGHLTSLRAHWSQMPDRRKAQSLDIAAASLDDLRAGLQVTGPLRSGPRPRTASTFSILATLLVLAFAAGWLVGFHHGRTQCPVPNLARVGP